ncbi:MAG TPA: carbonic anhydrase [Thermoanaerobaculaceae bacterium]|nr:carbonic anhydrase [Thermoanaerobaculaceae bacterium]
MSSHGPGETGTAPAAAGGRPIDAAAAVRAWSRIGDAAIRHDVVGALEALLAGNRRFVAGTPAPRDLHGERAALVSGQKPAAAVLACSDSRIAVEDAFDAPLGTVFGVRTAGGALDAAVLGSIEFAAASLGVRLIVVLGHEACGAVSAALGDETPAGALGALIAQLREHTAGAHGHEAAVRACAVATARHIVAGSPLLRAAFEGGRLAIVPAFYWLADGRVELIA